MQQKSPDQQNITIGSFIKQDVIFNFHMGGNIN